MSVSIMAFGSAAVPVEMRTAHAEMVHVSDYSLGTAPAGVLQERLQNSPTELVLLCEAGGIPTARTLESASQALEADPSLGAALIWPQKRLPSLPPRLAVLMFPPEHLTQRLTSVLVRKSAVVSIGGFREVAAPICDVLIRLAQAGRNLTSLDSEQDANSKGELPSDYPGPEFLPRLVPERPGENWDWLRRHLESLTPNDLRPGLTRHTVESTALLAGLWQLHDFLDESHQLSQSIEGRGTERLGDYWHAIMHRREPDYANAKYWFRQVGPHPHFSTLARVAAGILKSTLVPEAADWQTRLQPRGTWDPFAFVDLCAACAADETSPLALAARRIQRAEMMLLLHATYAALPAE